MRQVQQIFTTFLELYIFMTRSVQILRGPASSGNLIKKISSRDSYPVAGVAVFLDLAQSLFRLVKESKLFAERYICIFETVMLKSD
jgi:hypothetical protein